MKACDGLDLCACKGLHFCPCMFKCLCDAKICNLDLCVVSVGAIFVRSFEQAKKTGSGIRTYTPICLEQDVAWLHIAVHAEQLWSAS